VGWWIERAQEKEKRSRDLGNGSGVPGLRMWSDADGAESSMKSKGRAAWV
jgi:hypothetical protein